MAGLPSGTVTFLFTDIEGSSRLWDEHPGAMGEALVRHDALLREAVEANGGHVVKTTGDGVHAVFETAMNTVAAASAAVRALATEPWPDTGPLRVRMGIHTGAAELRDGDYYGPALNRASRLMAAAHGGQVVLSGRSADEVRNLLPEGLRLRDLGEHRLRGLKRPEHIFQLTISGLDDQFAPLASLEAFPGDLAVPFPSFATAPEQLAGRERELELLERALTSAIEGSKQVVLLAGESGMGKTTLAAELARRAAARGTVVLYGRCDEEAIVPHQPFVEALRPYIAAFPPSVLRERLHGLEGDLVRLFPELLGRVATVPEQLLNDPEAERYRLFEAITTVLTGAAATQPLVLLLDDLHWSDKPTLLLLRHLLRSASDVPLLVVVSYRDREVSKGHPLSDVLADLQRERWVTRVTLDGLSEAESGELLQSVAGQEVAPQLTAALYRETGGNPLFLGELLRHLIETDDAFLEVRGGGEFDLGEHDLPEGVRAVISRRIARLPGGAEELWTLAAVIGAEFDVALVERAAERSVEAVLDTLDVSELAGLVRPVSERAGRYGFAHDLIRQTLYADLGTAQRARLHARIGAAIEAAPGAEHATAALAQHFTQAAPLGEASKAITYTARAAHEALADLAFEDAVRYFERALELLDQYATDDQARRVDLLTDLADARLNTDEASAVEDAWRAIVAAREFASAETFGRAVAVFARANVNERGMDVSLFNEALAALGDGHPALRARLLALEAFQVATYTLQGEGARELAAEALALAREVGDAPTMADALFCLAISLEGTPDAATRVALGQELLALGDTPGWRARTYGLRVLARAQLELGDAEALASTIAELTHVGTDLRWLPARVHAALWRSLRALLEGRFDEFRRLGLEIGEFAHAYRGSTAIHLTQSAFVAREQEAFPMRDALEKMAASGRGSSYVLGMLAVAQLDEGDPASALATLDRTIADLGSFAQRDGGWPAALALLADVATRCDSEVHAQVLYEQLHPFSGHIVVALLGLDCFGAADRYLGMLGTVLGRWDETEHHFVDALALEEKVGGQVLVPRTRYWHARFLRARDRAGDADAARSILDQVVNESERLGLSRLETLAAQELAVL